MSFDFLDLALKVKKCYNYLMFSKILKSSTAKQIFGAAAGMLVAVAVYFLIQQFSYFSFSQALLVSPTNVSTKAHQIRVNDKNIDDATLRTIARNAQNVAALMKGEQNSAASSAPEVAPVAPSKAADTGLISVARQRRLALKQGQVYYMAGQSEPTEIDRINLRNELAAEAREGTAFSKEYVRVNTTEVNQTAAQNFQESPYVTSPFSEPKTLPKPRSGLPSSGFGLNVLMGITFLIAATFEVRKRLIAR